MIETLRETCQRRLTETGLSECPRHRKRLEAELREIDAQNEAKYFLDLCERRVRYPQNQNNLLTPYLLGIVQDFEIERDPNYVYGEFPDLDLDYLPIVRDYLKNEWAPKTFGQEFVCNISAYGTFGIKMAFLDMARVHGKDRSEIQDITKRLPNKDEEGHVLTFAKALELYPELKGYCEQHPDVAKAVKKLLHRTRSLGQHAGGLIICSDHIDNFVPLVKNQKDGTIASAWTEGLKAQDLGPVGLIKFDLLVVDGLYHIAYAARLVKERHGLQNICALPGQWDWSDLAYLNDPKALALATIGDLKCIFQFDSDGIRALARKGGVSSFEDLVAYAALYRPGPLGMGMHERYIGRKKGQEKYELHPIIEPYLGKTYGVLVFQEQIMQILNAVGDIPLKDCYVVIKAIAKKKLELFGPYKEQFIRVGKEKLGVNDEWMLNFWQQIESFAEYGFNRSHACAYTYISSRLLWLKAHYPLEFYTAALICQEKAEKIKEYKTEAERHGLSVRKVSLNKSGVTFQIVDDAIYMGFSNVKGIGEDKAKQIVAGQPYASFEDFLARFGTAATVVKPLVALRVFGDAEPTTLYKFCEHYKAETKRRADRRKRQQATAERHHEKLKALLPGLEKYAVFEDKYFKKWEERFNTDIELEDEAGDQPAEGAYDTEDGVEFMTAKAKKKWNRWKELKKLRNAYERSLRQDAEKTAREQANPPSLRNFNADEHTLPDALVEELRDEKLCEDTHYGFQWRTRLEESPDYKGEQTFEEMRVAVANGAAVFSVECEVQATQRKESKSGTTYHSLTVVDANGEKGYVTVWENDWERWHQEMKKDNLLKIRLMPPSGRFKSYTFESPPKHMRWKLPKDKREDIRLIVMRPPDRKPARAMTDREIMAELEADCKLTNS